MGRALAWALLVLGALAGLGSALPTQSGVPEEVGLLQGAQGPGPEAFAPGKIFSSLDSAQEYVVKQATAVVSLERREAKQLGGVEQEEAKEVNNLKSLDEERLGGGKEKRVSEETIQRLLNWHAYPVGKAKAEGPGHTLCSHVMTSC
jgi:hypothetical protein